MSKRPRHAWFASRRPLSLLVFVLALGLLTAVAVWTLALVELWQ